MNSFKAIIIILSLPILLMIMIYYMDLAYIKSEIPVKNLYELNTWINKNIEYKSDNIIKKDKEIFRDCWQYPRETLILKTGDCEDQAILFIYLAKKLFHIDCKGIWVTSILDGGHFIVLYDNIIFDQTFNVILKSSKYFYTYYYFVLYRAYTYQELLDIIPERRNLIFSY